MEVTLPSARPVIPDEAAAAAADIAMSLTADVLDYWFCFFEFAGLKDTAVGQIAVYKLAVDVKEDGSVIDRKGYCDVSIRTPDVQPGVPTINSGDLWHVAQIVAAPEYPDFQEFMRLIVP